MKRLLIIFSCFLCAIWVHAQNAVFVLVDISTSVSNTSLAQSKQALKDILQGNTPSNFTADVGNQTSISNLALMQNDKLMVMTFGKKVTIMNYSPVITPISILPSQLVSTIDLYYPSITTDNATFISLAKAKLAEIATRNRIKKYKLILISDNLYDDYGGNPHYSAEEQQLVDGYNTSTNPILEGPADVLKNNSDNRYQIRIQKMDITNYVPPGDSDGDGVPDASDKCPGTLSGTPVNSEGCPINIIEKASIIFQPNLKRSQQAPLVSESDIVSLIWTCPLCPPEIRFTLKVMDQNNRSNETFPNLSSPYTHKFKHSGLYKLTISAPNYAVNSDYTWVKKAVAKEVWIGIALVLLTACGLGYYYWNKNRQKTIDPLDSNNPDDLFSGGNSNSSGNSSSNSGYF